MPRTRVPSDGDSQSSASRSSAADGVSASAPAQCRGANFGPRLVRRRFQMPIIERCRRSASGDRDVTSDTAKNGRSAAKKEVSSRATR